MTTALPRTGTGPTGTDAEAAGGIRLQNVTKSYGKNRVLTDVTVDLEPGVIYGLLGPNGAGKTTLMSLISNHIFRTSGTVLIDGENPAENAGILERTCFVREDQTYNTEFKVKHILQVLPAFYPQWDQALADRLIARFHLPANTKSAKLSRGQRSALAIIIALASRAPYTFLDEPYLGLDPTARSIFYDELIRDYSEHPRTIVMSTHLIDEAADLMEDVLVLHGGRIALRANVDEARSSAFIARGLEDEVRDLIGGRDILSERNLGRILSATVRGRPSEADRRRADELRISIEPASLQDLVAAIGLTDIGGLDASATTPGELR